MERTPGLITLVTVAILTVIDSPSARALPMGHHGGLITQCTDPTFYDQTPPPDQHLSSLETIRASASPNTEPTSIEVRVNLEVVKPEIKTERSGYHTIEVKLPKPITSGRAWIKITAMSNDGCHALTTWNVYTGQ